MSTSRAGRVRLRVVRHAWTAIAAALAACALGAVPAVAASCPGADLEPSAANLDVIRAATLCLINGERAANGLNALHVDDRLTRSSTAHSQDMVARRYFEHVNPEGMTPRQRMAAAGYLDGATWWIVGENIAAADAPLYTPAQVVRAWMASTGHRENILESGFRDIGIGITLGSPRRGDVADAATYTTDFGTVETIFADVSAAPAAGKVTAAAATPKRRIRRTCQQARRARSRRATRRTTRPRSSVRCVRRRTRR